MARNPEVVRIPKPAPGSFNKNRPAGQLLRMQVLHLHHALARHLEETAALLAINVHALKTEGQVSDYSKKVTAILHLRAAKRPGK